MREREAPEPGDLDPDFLPQETLRRTGDSSYERVAPSDNWAGDEPEVRSDFFEHHHEIFVPTTRTAEIFGNCHTSKAQFGESTELVDRKFGPFIEFF